MKKFICLGVVVGVMLFPVVSAKNKTSGERVSMQIKADCDAIQQLLMDLSSNDKFKAREAFKRLYEKDMEVVPCLLPLAEDADISVLNLPIWPIYSFRYDGIKFTKGTVALYLIEAIRMQQLIHCHTPQLIYEGQKSDPYSIKKQIKNQKRAVEAYRAWWEKNGQRWQRNQREIIAPWNDALARIPYRHGENWDLYYFFDSANSIEEEQILPPTAN